MPLIQLGIITLPPSCLSCRGMVRVRRSGPCALGRLGAEVSVGLARQWPDSGRRPAIGRGYPRISKYSLPLTVTKDDSRDRPNHILLISHTQDESTDLPAPRMRHPSRTARLPACNTWARFPYSLGPQTLSTARFAQSLPPCCQHSLSSLLMFINTEFRHIS